MDFSALTAYLDSLKDVGMPGCDLAVYRDHRKIYRHHAGFRDREAGVPMDWYTDDSRFCSIGNDHIRRARN